MDFLSQLLRGIAFVPALVNGIEGLFGNKPGAEKKDAAMLFLQNALARVTPWRPGKLLIRKVQRWHFKDHRWHGGMPERFDLVQATACHKQPTNANPKLADLLAPSLERFLHEAMNWSATAPSMRRWS